jgi:hypothetical protein
MFVGTQVYKVQNGFIGLGVGEDVVDTELEFTKNKGNAGYREMNERYYSEELEAKKNETYAIMTVSWKGEATVGTKAMNTGNNILMLAAEDIADLPTDIFANIPGCPYIEEEETEDIPDLVD